MKKWIALVLVFGCVFCLAQCTGEKAQVSEWARGLSRADIDSAEPWQTLEPLNEEETQKLVTLLNKLTTSSFTENKTLAGGTPEYGISIHIASETYHLNESIHPKGSLEIGYQGKLWLIDNRELADFVRTVADRKTHEGNMKTYMEMGDGTWQCGGYTYRYRLEISGRMHGAEADSTFVYLSNLENITFDQAWKAAGLSSNLADYFAAEDAVLVEWRTE